MPCCVYLRTENHSICCQCCVLSLYQMVVRFCQISTALFYLLFVVLISNLYIAFLICTFRDIIALLFIHLYIFICSFIEMQIQ